MQESFKRRSVGDAKVKLTYAIRLRGSPRLFDVLGSRSRDLRGRATALRRIGCSTHYDAFHERPALQWNHGLVLWMWRLCIQASRTPSRNVEGPPQKRLIIAAGTNSGVSTAHDHLTFTRPLTNVRTPGGAWHASGTTSP